MHVKSVVNTIGVSLPDGVIAVDPQQLKGKKGWYIKAKCKSAEYTMNINNHARVVRPVRILLTALFYRLTL